MRQRIRRAESGQAILEAAVMLPVLVFVALALIDMQWMLKDASNLDYIVNETARCEALAALPCTTPKTPEAYAVSMATNFRLDTGTGFHILTPPCSVYTGVCSVTITYQYRAIGAWFPSLTITRTGIAAYRGAGG